MSDKITAERISPKAKFKEVTLKIVIKDETTYLDLKHGELEDLDLTDDAGDTSEVQDTVLSLARAVQGSLGTIQYSKLAQSSIEQYNKPV